MEKAWQPLESGKTGNGALPVLRWPHNAKTYAASNEPEDVMPAGFVHRLIRLPLAVRKRLTFSLPQKRSRMISPTPGTVTFRTLPRRLT